MIKIKNAIVLTKNEKNILLNDINMQFCDSNLYLITGEKEKTEFLLKIISLNKKIYKGNIFIDDVAVAKMNSNQLYYFKNSCLYLNEMIKESENVKAEDLISEILKLHECDLKSEEVISLCNDFNIADSILKSKISDLDEIDKIKISLVRCVLSHVKVLFVRLDEIKSNILELLKEASRHNIAIVCTSEKELNSDFFDEIYKVEGSNVVQIKHGEISKNKISNIDIPVPNSKFLRFRDALKSALCGIKKNIVFVVITAFVLLVSLFSFTTTSVYIAPPFVSSQINESYKNEEKTVYLTNKRSSLSVEQSLQTGLLPFASYIEKNTALKSKQIEVLKDNDVFIPVLNTNLWNNLFSYFDKSQPKVNYEYGNIYYDMFSKYGIRNFVMIDPIKDATKLHLEKDERVTVENRLPKDSTEIAVTDYIADMLSNNDTNSIIGRGLFDRRVVGVFKTEENRIEFKNKYDFEGKSEEEIKTLVAEYKKEKTRSVMSNYHPMLSCFVYRGNDMFTNQSNVLYKYKDKLDCIYPLSGDKNKDIRFLKSLDLNIGDSENSYDIYAKYFITVLSQNFSNIESKNNRYGQIRKYDNTIVFAYILFFLTLVTSIVLLSIGVRKSLDSYKSRYKLLILNGMKSSSIFYVGIITAMIITVPILLLSFLLSSIVGIGLNLKIYFSLYSLTLPIVLISIVLVFVIINLCSFIAKKSFYKKN